MITLKRVYSEIFEEMYEGVNGTKLVYCILDDYCVRYVVRDITKPRVRGVRHEFANDKKELCFKNALKALNK